MPGIAEKVVLLCLLLERLSSIRGAKRNYAIAVVIVAFSPQRDAICANKGTCHISTVIVHAKVGLLHFLFLFCALSQVKEALDYLSFLPPKSAEGFLKAIQVHMHAVYYFKSVYEMVHLTIILNVSHLKLKTLLFPCNSHHHNLNDDFPFKNLMLLLFIQHCT